MSKVSKRSCKTLIALVLTWAVLCTALYPLTAKAESKRLSLNSTEETILVGKTFNFNINNKIKGSTYSWRSSNPNVALVKESNGVVTGVYKGSTWIHCAIKTQDNVTYHLRARVHVIKPAIHVEINNKISQMNVNDTYNLNRTIIPESSDDEVVWTSSDKTIADPMPNGIFRAKAAGTVTITATTLSKRSDSVTIRVLEEGEDPNDNDDPGDDEGDIEDDVTVIETILNEDFSSSLGIFTGRTASVSHVIAGIDAEGGKGLMRVSGRTSNWNGAIADITDLVEPGATYRVTGWVRYTSGEDIETFKVSQDRISSEENQWPEVAQVEVPKGEWTKIIGIMEIAPSTTQCQFYFETLSLIDFMVDSVTIELIEADLIVEEDEDVEEAKIGDIVYQNDFEDGSVCDSRGSSVRTNTTEYAHSGKASVEVSRGHAWDGAGVRFASTNDIKKASLYGKTVQAQFYIMYAQGPDEVEFKLNNRMESSTEEDTILSQVAIKKGEWILLEADCYIDGKSTDNLIFIETEGNDDLTFYIDDIDIKVVN